MTYGKISCRKVFSVHKMHKNATQSHSEPHFCLRSCKKHYSSNRRSKFTADRLTLLPTFLTKEPQASDSTPDSEGQSLTLSGYYDRVVEESSSRSIFKEIKHKFRQGGAQEWFGVDALKLHNLDLKEDYWFAKKVRREVDGVNLALSGVKNMSSRKRPYNEEEKENYPIKFSHIPPSSWVFQTPPNRKLNFTQMKVEESSIKPAVIRTKNEKTVIYEMNKKVNVNLTGFTNREEIDIDNRYMMEVTDDEVDSSKFQSDFELENHFLSLTCRPKKPHTTVPRSHMIKKKRDIFEEPEACSSATPEDFRPATSGFLDSLNLETMEESFTFKFTNDETVEGGTMGHIFDYKGNKKNTFNLRF